MAVAQTAFAGSSANKGGYAYVVQDGGLIVINTTTNTIIGSLDTGSQYLQEPYGLAISPNGEYAYTINDQPNYAGLMKINLSTGTIKQFAHNAGYLIAISPDGTYGYVSDCNLTNDNCISVFNTSTGTIEATIPDPNWNWAPFDAAFSPDGTFAYVTVPFPRPGTNDISIINTETNTVDGGFNVPGTPWGVTFLPNDNRAYISAVSNVYVIDTSTNAIIDTIPTSYTNCNECGYLAASPDGKYVYVVWSYANAQSPVNGITIINTTTNRVVGNITSTQFSYSEGVAFGPYTPSPAPAPPILSFSAGNSVPYGTNDLITAANSIGNSGDVIQLTVSNTLTNAVVESNSGTSLASNDICGSPAAITQCLGAGTYNVVAKDLNNNLITTNTLTIMQASIPNSNGLLTLTLPTPNSMDYNGANSPDITAAITSVDNQLTANVVVNNDVFNSVFTGTNTFAVGPGANTYFITTSTPGNGNYLPANVSNTFVINKAPLITLMASPSQITIGSAVTLVATITGGTGPYTIVYYSSAGSPVGTGALGTSSGSNTLVFTPGSTGTFTFNAVAIDKGTSAPFIFNSIPSDPVTVSSAPSPSRPSSNGGGGGGGGVVGGGTFRPAVSTINNTCYLVSNLTAPDYAVVNFTGISFNIRANFISPTDAGVTVNSTSPYTLYPNNTISILNTAKYNYTMKLTGISYIPAVHTITLAVCTISKVKPSPNAPTNTITNATATTSTTTILPTTTIAAVSNSMTSNAVAAVPATSAPPWWILWLLLLILLLVLLWLLFLQWKRRRKSDGKKHAPRPSQPK
ncbi:MAG: YncE family protein [Candidatus Marsarchaeota archaeon]|nr:YncE family protein [Candidatus Marsarchaeota archaeon]